MVTHHTAAEIVYERADSTKPNMGLTTWKNAPKGRIRKSDVTVAKNYLNETEMKNLDEIVTMYLDYAERQARRGNVMYMADCSNQNRRYNGISSERKPTLSELSRQCVPFF